MSDSKTDRRSRERVPVRLPLTVRPKNGSAEQAAYTRDLTSNGVFFYSDSGFSEGSQLEMVLILPPELTFGEKRWVCCQASVVRVEEDAGRRYGVAAVIEKFEILPEIPD